MTRKLHATTRARNAVAATLLALTAAHAAHAVTFTSFAFTSQVSTSGLFGNVNGIYGNGDVRLDSVTFGGNTYGQDRIATVTAATIVLDDGLDAVNGGGNLAAGRGINAPADPWAGQGPATVTPNGADLAAALGNHNLSSIVVTRENAGAAILDVSFALPADTFIFYERGFNSDLQVQALNASNQVIGTYTVLRANYTRTGIIVTTDNGAFLNNGQALGSIGLHSDVALSRLRLSSYNSDVLSFNGPDYKILAVSAVPEPGAAALALAGALAVGWTARRRRSGATVGHPPRRDELCRSADA
jgi:hypothetical protein